jgi:hypothetical protein
MLVAWRPRLAFEIDRCKHASVNLLMQRVGRMSNACSLYLIENNLRALGTERADDVTNNSVPHPSPRACRLAAAV